MPTAALRALVFDFDGMIVDTGAAGIDAWEQIHREDELIGDRAVLHALVGGADVDGDIWRAYPFGVSREKLGARHRALARRLALARPVEPGVRELLAEARAESLRVGLASDSGRAHVERHLRRRGLLRFFDAIVCREDVRAGKPEPDVYLTALSRLGVDARAAVAFEGSRPGHLAAHRAGLRVMAVPNPATARDTFDHATWRRDSLAGFGLDALRKLLAADQRGRPARRA